MTPLRKLQDRVLKSRPVRDYGVITAGVITAAFGFNAFLIPNKLAAGGLSGLATVVYHTVRSAAGVTIPVGIQMLVANVVLLSVGIRLRGWRYGAKVIYGAVALSVAIDASAPFTPHLAANDPLLAVLYGGALTGLGVGLVFKAGGNTGGTDIVAQLLTRRISIGVGQAVLLVDAAVMVAAAIAFGPTLALYGFVAVFVSGTVIDVLQEGFSVEKVALIISDRAEEIVGAILAELDRGSTSLSGRGHSGKEREVIMCVVNRRQLDDLKSIVRAIDPGAFLIITDSHETLGEGFKRLETR